MSENAETYETVRTAIKELADMIVPMIALALMPRKPLSGLPIPGQYAPALAYCPHLRDVRLEVTEPVSEGDVRYAEWSALCAATDCQCELLSAPGPTLPPYRDCATFLLNLAMQAKRAGDS